MSKGYFSMFNSIEDYLKVGTRVIPRRGKEVRVVHKTEHWTLNMPAMDWTL